MRLLCALVAGLVVLVTAGCGGDSDQSTSSGPVGTSMKTAAATTDEEENREHFTVDNWGVLAGDIDGDPAANKGADQFAHKGASVDVIGKIVAQRRRDADGVFFQMAVGSAASEFETFVTSRDTSLRVSGGDYVHVLGELIEAVGYVNEVGQEVWVPHVLASEVEVVDG